MEEYYGNNDWRDYSLQHSWGKKPEQKKREKEYNAWYWKTHKEEIMKKRGSKNRPLARETNVTGKGKSVYRRTGETDKLTGITKTDAYNQTLKEVVSGSSQLPEDATEFWVYMYENGVELTKAEAEKMYAGFIRDVKAGKIKNAAEEKSKKKTLDELTPKSMANKSLESRLGVSDLPEMKKAIKNFADHAKRRGGYGIYKNDDGGRLDLNMAYRRVSRNVKKDELRDEIKGTVYRRKKAKKRENNK